MGTLLVRNAQVLVTMDGTRRELAGAGFFARDGVIEAVGAGLPEAADEVVEARGCVVTPGLVNTHHHLFQTLTRALPGGQDAGLFAWLKRLYPIWAAMEPEDIRVSAALGLGELALSGCTMSSDHLYLFPNGARLDDAIEAAAESGLRFHATRGAMSIGESRGGLPPDRLVEAEEAILKDSERVIERWHDPRPQAMLRVALAPCSPFSVSRELMRDAAHLARDRGVMLHTHLAENDDDVAYSLAHFGCRPGQYAEELGWTGPDVWHAHCVKLDGGEQALFARTGTGIAHCPCSNCRLGSGLAPLSAWLGAGLKVGLGVDGSASNDAGDLIAEARQAMLLQRLLGGAGAMTARAALELATLGGARVLGRADLGSLEPGKGADFVLWPLDGLGDAGTWDPVAGLVLTGPHRPRAVYVAGRAVVREGRLARVDGRKLAARARRRRLALFDRAGA